MTVRKIKSIGDVPYPIDDVSDAFSPLLTAGAALGITGEATDSSAWLQRVSTSDGPTTIRSIHGNTIVQDGALVPVNMTGIETTGFNQWDEVWEVGSISQVNGGDVASTDRIRSKNYIPVFGGMRYFINQSYGVCASYDGDKNYIGNTPYASTGKSGEYYLDPQENTRYIRFSMPASYGTTYKGDICINLSWSGRRNGEYEAFWKSQRLIDVASYFPDGMRSAGSVYDELTETAAIHRVGEVDLGTLDWRYDTDNGRFNTTVQLPDMARTSYRAETPCAKYVYGATGAVDKTVFAYNGGIYVYDTAYTDAAAFKTAMSGVMLYYELATPTITPIDPPLNLSYRVDDFGTERVMVPAGELSAPPTIVAAQGYTAESLRDAALSAIAPVENGKASTNYGIGSYLVHGGQLCKVTTAIATGESITIGTNVTTTTVMAEVLSLTQ